MNILQVRLAVGGQDETNKVHRIQHCVTFSFVNPKMVFKWQNTFEETVCKVALKANELRNLCSESRKTSRTLGLKRNFLFFSFFLHDFKKIYNNGNVVYAERNPLNTSFFWVRFFLLFFFSFLALRSWKMSFSTSVWRKEVVQTKPLADVRSDVFILWRTKKKRKPVTLNFLKL